MSLRDDRPALADHLGYDHGIAVPGPSSLGAMRSSHADAHAPGRRPGHAHPIGDVLDVFGEDEKRGATAKDDE